LARGKIGHSGENTRGPGPTGIRCPGKGMVFRTLKRKEKKRISSLKGRKERSGVRRPIMRDNRKKVGSWGTQKEGGGGYGSQISKKSEIRYEASPKNDQDREKKDWLLIKKKVQGTATAANRRSCLWDRRRRVSGADVGGGASIERGRGKYISKLKKGRQKRSRAWIGKDKIRL